MTGTAQNMSIFRMMSGIGRKTNRWHKAGLISETQREDIVAFEKAAQRKRFMRGLVGLALFAIASGILSVVAANWVYISGDLKLIAHFALNILAALFMIKGARENNMWLRESACALFFALNLTFIALIGQTFQLSGSIAMTLALWLGISSPAVFVYGRTALNAVPWIGALLTTLFFVCMEIDDYFSDFTVLVIGLALTLYIPLMMIAAGGIEKLRETRPHWAILCFRGGVVILAVMATLASFWWYGDMSQAMPRVLELSGSFATGYAAIAAITLSALLAVFAYSAVMEKGIKLRDRSGMLFVTGSLVSIALPLLLMPPDMDFMAAVHFIAYWSFTAWVAHRMAYEQLLSKAITLIALRIFIIYIELFGGLLMTGFGLIGSGVLLLIFVRAVGKFKARLTAQTQNNGG